MRVKLYLPRITLGDQNRLFMLHPLPFCGRRMRFAHVVSKLREKMRHRAGTNGNLWLLTVPRKKKPRPNTQKKTSSKRAPKRIRYSIELFQRTDYGVPRLPPCGTAQLFAEICSDHNVEDGSYRTKLWNPPNRQTTAVVAPPPSTHHPIFSHVVASAKPETHREKLPAQVNSGLLLWTRIRNGATCECIVHHWLTTSASRKSCPVHSRLRKRTQQDLQGHCSDISLPHTTRASSCA